MLKTEKSYRKIWPIQKFFVPLHRQNKRNMLYAVAFKRRESDSNYRFIRWCDEHWYESSGMPLPNFTLDEAHTIAKQMRNHYSYVIEILDENNEVIEHINWLTKKVTKKKPETPITPTVKTPREGTKAAKKLTVKLNTERLMKRAAAFISKK